MFGGRGIYIQTTDPVDKNWKRYKKIRINWSKYDQERYDECNRILQLEEHFQAIDKPVHLQVFVTPTCPYCPRAVLTAFKFAMLNENITADMIEATEFQELSMKFNVQGVPKTVINDDWDIVGAVPEKMVLDKVKEALKDNMTYT